MNSSNSSKCTDALVTVTLFRSIWITQCRLHLEHLCNPVTIIFPHIRRVPHLGQLETCSSDRKSFSMGGPPLCRNISWILWVKQANCRLNIKRRQANFLAIPNGMQEAHLPPLGQLRRIFKKNLFLIFVFFGMSLIWDRIFFPARSKQFIRSTSIFLFELFSEHKQHTD